MPKQLQQLISRFHTENDADKIVLLCHKLYYGKHNINTERIKKVIRTRFCYKEEWRILIAIYLYYRNRYCRWLLLGNNSAKEFGWEKKEDFVCVEPLIIEEIIP